MELGKEFHRRVETGELGSYRTLELKVVYEVPQYVYDSAEYKTEVDRRKAAHICVHTDTATWRTDSSREKVVFDCENTAQTYTPQGGGVGYFEKCTRHQFTGGGGGVGMH